MSDDITNTKLNPKLITSGQTDRYIRTQASHLSPTEKALLGYLKSYIYWSEAKHGYVRSMDIKVATMCSYFKRSRATIQRWLAKLTESGEILAQRQYWPNGREKVSFYTFPNLTKWLLNIDGREQINELKSQEESIQANKNEAPIKHGLSSSKKIAYIRFSDFGKNDFLRIEGSIKYIPRIAGIIRKLRPGIDPDVIFKFFKEWISKPDFVLRKGSSYVKIFWSFVRTCRVPFDGSYKSKPLKTAVNIDRRTVFIEAKPTTTDEPDSRFRLALFAENSGAYKHWFAQSSIKIEGSKVVVCGCSSFATSYIEQHYKELLCNVAHGLGLSILIRR